MVRGVLRRWNSCLNSCLSSPARTLLCGRTIITAGHNATSRPRHYGKYDSNGRERYQPQTDLRLAPRRALQAQNIGLNPMEVMALKMKHPGLIKFGTGIFTARRHVVHLFHMRYLDTTGHALGSMFSTMLLRQDAQPLWWKASAQSTDARSCFRHKVKDRLGCAFKQALMKRGWDATGRRLPQPADGSVRYDMGGQGGKIVQLFGTVHIKSMEPKVLWNAPFDDLVSWMGHVVTALEGELGQTESGESVATPLVRRGVRPFMPTKRAQAARKN